MTRVWERAVGFGAVATAVVLLIFALLVGVRVEAAAGLEAEAATVRLAAVPGRPAAGYVTLSGADATLVSVSSPLASRIEMHSSTMAGGVMRMDRLTTATVRAAAPLVFAPGGSHLMIFGLHDVKQGGTVPLLFTFKGGRTLRVEARAVAAGAAMTGHDSH